MAVKLLVWFGMVFWQLFSVRELEVHEPVCEKDTHTPTYHLVNCKTSNEWVCDPWGPWSLPPFTLLFCCYVMLWKDNLFSSLAQFKIILTKNSTQITAIASWTDSDIDARSNNFTHNLTEILHTHHRHNLIVIN